MRLTQTLILFLVSTISIFAQGETTILSSPTPVPAVSQPPVSPRPRPTRPDDGLSLDKGTIADQFKFVMTRSNNYQNKKIIRGEWLIALKAHVLDSLGTFKKALANERQQVITQKDEIEALQNKLGTANDEIKKLTGEKSSISFLGAQMNKSAYKGLVWTIIAGLLSGLLFFLYRFKQSNSITTETRKTVEDLRGEFEAYKKRALEREQKVRRELQNVLNKRGEQ